MSWTIRVLFLAGTGHHHHVQTSSGAHPSSYPMGTRVSLPMVSMAQA